MPGTLRQVELQKEALHILLRMCGASVDILALALASNAANSVLASTSNTYMPTFVCIRIYTYHMPAPLCSASVSHVRNSTAVGILSCPGHTCYAVKDEGLSVPWQPRVG